MAHRKIPKALERELSRLEETAKTLQNNYANAVSFYNTVAEGCKRWKQYDYQDLLYPTTLKVVAHINCHRLPTARQLGEGRWSLNPDRLIATFGPEILLSEKFLRKLRDFMKLSEMVFDEALQSLMIQQNIRRSHPRAGVSSRRLWAPADVEKAMDALGLSKKKRSLNEAEIEPVGVQTIRKIMANSFQARERCPTGTSSGFSRTRCERYVPVDVVRSFGPGRFQNNHFKRNNL
jgi:hypothetical protein